MAFLYTGLKLHEGMKQAWYLRPGQTLDNTKVCYRQNALICTKNGWKIFDDHLNKKQLKIEAAKREKAMNIYLKEGSASMKEHWPDSIENLRKLRFEKIKKDRKDKKLAQSKRYVEMMQENEVERQALLKRIKRETFQENYNVRKINRAAQAANILHERNLQLAFQKKLREMERAKESAMPPDNFIEKFMGNEQEKLQAHKLRDNQYRAELLHQILETEEHERIEHANQLQKERQHLAEMAEEKREDDAEKYNARRRQQHAFRVGILESKRLHKEYVDHVEAIDREENRQNEILLKYKHRIESILHKNAKVEREKKHEITEHIGQQIFAQMQSNTQAEENRLKRSMHEAEQRYLAREKAQVDRKEKLVKELNEYYRKHDEEMKIAETREQQRHHFQMLDRKKNEEMYGNYLEHQHKLRDERIRTIKNDLVAQQCEKKRKRERETEQEHEDLQHFNNCLRKTDAEVMDYANRTLEELKQKSYPTFPVERALHDFRLAHGYATTERYKRNVANRGLIPKQRPGRRTTNPQDDPTFGRCHCYKDRLFH